MYGMNLDVNLDVVLTALPNKSLRLTVVGSWLWKR